MHEQAQRAFADVAAVLRAQMILRSQVDLVLQALSKLNALQAHAHSSLDWSQSKADVDHQRRGQDLRARQHHLLQRRS